MNDVIPTPLAPERRHALLEALQERFERHPKRHPDLSWSDVLARVDARPDTLCALEGMEASGGEPDVVGRDEETGAIVFVDCSPESPSGRRSLCYDHAAQKARSRNRPRGNVVDEAAALGIELLTEEEYRALQTMGAFDERTSSWVATPPEVRALGGALFCDRRYGRVFTFHNGAESYYAARGFRGSLRV
ncbi:MAG TPA: DUF4256 domain-containing protein [Candidatus Rubneribacter avistercoris]|nr:DUF4256 domain-containing protein [Candidatus Rubneribacter avistercoris]